MIGLLRGELLKAVTTRAVWGFAAGGMAFAALNAVLVSVASGTLDEVGEKKEALSGLPVLLLLWGLVGAAGEYRHRTAAPAALVARRGRGTVLAVRIAAYALTGLGLAVLINAVAAGVALPLLADQPGPDLTPGQVAGVAAGNVLALVLATVLGGALGALIRGPVVGAVVLLILDLVVQPLVSGVWEREANLSPFGAVGVMTGGTHDTTLTVAQAGAVFAVWTALAVVVAVACERRRDLA
ncbi:ABC transporter permease [Actinomadura fibrosa]|uniref:ABC transporter permease n=1 Tax=Actinomadura fibrosa TaxID=111802 RepID=A0ABW2XXQ4_9ACTN|nr:ABC transporter permease [Actinomadura fibrosa]